jgi:hypothetical protein
MMGGDLPRVSERFEFSEMKVNLTHKMEISGYLL